MVTLKKLSEAKNTFDVLQEQMSKQMTYLLKLTEDDEYHFEYDFIEAKVKLVIDQDAYNMRMEPLEDIYALGFEQLEIITNIETNNLLYVNLQ